MKKRITDLMDAVQNTDVELNQNTPLSSQRIKELTMNKITNNRSPRRTGFRVLVAAAVIVTLTVTVFAAGNMAGWFRKYFQKQTDAPLTPGQIQFIEENEQVIEDMQTIDEWSVELKTYIASARTVYMVFGITAPEGVDISSTGNTVFLEYDISGARGRINTSNTIRYMDDGDGNSNTIEYVHISERTDTRDTNTEWKIHISSIYRPKDDETLAEGDWNFTLDLSKGNAEAVELISDPIQTLAKIYLEDPLPGEPIAALDYLTVSSIRLSPLEVIILYEPINTCYAYFEGPIEGTGIVINAYAIMKDGSGIPLRAGQSSFNGEAKLIAESPIVMDDVECIFMPDGTKIMVP